MWTFVDACSKTPAVLKWELNVKTNNVHIRVCLGWGCVLKVQRVDNKYLNFWFFSGLHAIYLHIHTHRKSCLKRLSAVIIFGEKAQWWAPSPGILMSSTLCLCSILVSDQSCVLFLRVSCWLPISFSTRCAFQILHNKTKVCGLLL